MVMRRHSSVLPRRSRALARLTALVMVLGLLLVSTSPASAEGSAKWLTFEGECWSSSGGSEQVLIRRAPRAGIFAAFSVSGNRTLVPYWLQYELVEGVTAARLKSRHTFPVGTPITKPGPAPRNPVTCQFGGLLPNTGDAEVPFTATVIGAMHGGNGAPAHQG